MAKVINKVLLLLGLLVSSYSFGDSSVSELQRTCVTECALQENGVKEATGNNDGVRVNEYQRAAGLANGTYYCAAFCCFIYQGCGVPVPKSGWCPSFFPENRVIYDRRNKVNGTPQGGDMMGIYFKSEGRIAHCGIIIQWGKEVTTVEGNSNAGGNSRNGDGVHKKYRDMGVIYQVAKWIE